ncbi:hypothetical protein P0082_10530 [Candidatus Haliotispira prima]|uniref:Fibronectin type-III domain-containing protein n=1 Tax=Candidatus Haliotispira prima TaxID=3034016 RepID=A0ABY8MFX8_9SPIO|nr:hypothetical protein P0082_10530 [Candidatus Haliotispira prima]
MAYDESAFIFRRRLVFALLALLAIFTWSCEESTDKRSSAPKSYMVIKKDPVTADDGRYVFEMTSFVSADQMIYEEGDVPNEKLQALWTSAVVRWGFRRKDSPDRVYWVQKNRAYTKDDGNYYSTEVGEKDKAKFVPQELPSALLQVPESNLEIYAMVNVEDLEIMGTYDLPEDFKTKIMQVTELSGRVFNFSSMSGGSGRAKIVSGAGIYYIHKDTGKIFHTFSDVGGNYRISVQYYGAFFRVVLTHNMAPLVASYNLDYVAGRALVSQVDIGINELATGVSVAEGQLYDISSGILGVLPAGGTPVSGSTVDSRNTKMIPGAFLLFYDKGGQRIYFLKSGLDGRFSFSLPAATVTVNSETPVSSPSGGDSLLSFIPGAYGYTSISGYTVLGVGKTPAAVLGVVGFEPKAGIEMSDLDRDSLLANRDLNDKNWDYDGDGIPDGADVDIDGDGTKDNGKDTDGDGINDISDALAGDPDADRDGIKDSRDRIDNRKDQDKDGLPDDIDPNDSNPDTDGDGIPDGADVDVNNDGTKDNGKDTDGDGINDRADTDANGDGSPDTNKPDADSDGLSDVLDPVNNNADVDKDGLPDNIDPNDNNWDTDGDGIPDGADVDVNGDGTKDNGTDTDRDGINDRSDVDVDGDGNWDTGRTDSDGDGIRNSTDTIDANVDADRDGLPDGIDPNNNNPDVDSDGIPDGSDVDINGDGTNDNGTDRDRDGINDANDPIDNNGDRDRDGLADGPDPNDDNWDTDGDGIPDGVDVDVNGDGTNDNGTDTDGDGIRDRADVNSNPGKPDSDRDGIIDIYDVADNRRDADKDGLPDAFDPNDDNWDTDGDGIPDGADVDVNGDKTDDNGKDTDGDGINDRADIDANLRKSDSDGDKIIDDVDTINNKQDADKDGLPDDIDPNDNNWDTDGDGIPDGADVDVNGDGTNDNGIDTDGDGINDLADIDANPGKSDSDGDSIIDDFDTIDNRKDEDNDDLPDTIDPDRTNVDTDGDGIKDGNDADVNGDGITDNGKDANNDGVRDGVADVLKPRLSWDVSATTNTQDLNGGKFDFGGSPVTVNLRIVASALGDRNFTYKWFRGTGTTVAGAILDSSQTGASASFRLNSPGPNVIVVRVRNSGGESLLFKTYDLNKPPYGLRITSPSAGQSLNLNAGAAVPLSVSATEDDNGQTLSYSWLIAPGRGVTAASAFRVLVVGAGSTYVFTQAAGDYTLKARASDADGGSVEGTVSVILRGDASGISSSTRLGIGAGSGSTRPAPQNDPFSGDGSVTSSATVTMNNVVRENGGVGIRSVSWLVDGITQTGTTAFTSGRSAYGETFTIRDPAIPHTITMVAVNTLGEETRRSQTYYLNQAPEFDESATTGTVQSYDISTAQNINVTARDVNGGTMAYTASVAPGFNVPDTGTYRDLTSSLTGPSGVTRAIPLNFDIGLSTGSYTLRIVVRDQHGGARDVLLRNIRLTGTSTVISPTAPAISWVNGTTNFVAGTDTASAANSKSDPATVIPYVNPVGSSYETGSRALVTVRVTDRRASPKTYGFTYRWTLDGSVLQSTQSGMQSSVVVPNMRLGLSVLSLIVTNDDGQSSAEAVRKYYVNKAPENLRIADPTLPRTIQLAGSASKTVNFRAEATDGNNTPGSGATEDPINYTWKVYPKLADGRFSTTSYDNAVRTGSSYNIDFSSFTANEYQIVVSATDSHGAAAVPATAGSDRMTIYVNAAPVVNFVAPTSGTASVGSDVGFRISVSDANLASPNLDTDFGYAWDYQTPGNLGSSSWSTLPSDTVVSRYNVILKTGGLSATTGTTAYRMRVTVRDNKGGTTIRTFDLRLTANAGPTLKFLGTTTVTDNEKFQLTSVNAGTPGQNFYVNGDDPDGQTLTYSWTVNGRSEGPGGTGAAGKSLLNRVFYSPMRGNTKTPAQLTAELTGLSATQRTARLRARHEVVVSASASDGMASATSNRSLLLNVVPVISIVTAPKSSLNPGESVTFTASVSDAEGDDLSYEWEYYPESSPGTVLPINVASGHRLSGNTATLVMGSDWALGAYRVRVRVRDNYGGSANTHASPKQVTLLRAIEKLAMPVPGTGTVTATSITLNWSRVANASSYTLTRTGSSGVVTKGSSDTSHTYTGLTANTLYTFTVRARGVGGYSDSDIGTRQIRTSNQKLATPVLRATRVATTSVILSWASIPNAGSYTLSRTGSSSIITKSRAYTSYQFTGLTASTQYTFSITARGASGYSDSDTGTLQARTSASQLTIPAIWRSLENSTSVKIFWHATPNATAYALSRTGSTEVILKTADTISYTFTGLTPETEYTVSVVAVGEEGLYSDSPAGSKVVRTLKRKLETPVLREGDKKDFRVTLHWNTIAGATGYVITVTGSSNVVTKSSSDTSHTFYLITEAKEAKSVYTVSIFAKSDGISYLDSDAGSLEVRIVNEKLPTPVLRLDRVDQTTVTLLWARGLRADGYRFVYEKTGSNDRSAVIESMMSVRPGTNDIAQTFSGLSLNTSYTFYVVAYDSGGYKDSDAGSLEVRTLKRKTSEVPSLNLGSVTETSVTVYWATVAGIHDGYILSRSGSAETVRKPKNTANHIFQGLTADTEYTFSIKAIGVGDYTDSDPTTLVARTAASPTEKLATPVLSTGTVTATSVTLNWAAIANVGSYRVSRSGGLGGSVTKGSSVTSHTFTGLTAGESYSFVVWAVGTGSYSNSDPGVIQVSTLGQAPSTEKLATPVLRTGVVTIEGLTQNWAGVTLFWNSVPNAGSYRVSRSGSLATVTKSSSMTSHIFTGLSGNTMYTFSVTAVGTGSYTDSDTGTIQLEIGAQRLAAPVLSTGTVTATSVTLNWAAIANAGSYRLSRTGSDVSVTKSSSDTSHTFAGLTANNLYTFSIMAVGAGSYSDSGTGTRQVRTLSQGPPAQKLATPVLNAGTVTATSVILNWAGIANAGGYRVSRTGSNVTVTKSSSATSHTFTGLTANNAYTFSVTAISTGSYSNSDAGTLQIRTLSQVVPSNKLATPVVRTGTLAIGGATQNWAGVTLFWNSVANAGGYRVSRTGSSSPVTKSSSATSHTFTGLTGDTLYTFSVTAIGTGSYSDSDPGIVQKRTAKQKLATPVLNAGTVTATSVTLNWAGIANAGSYSLSRTGSNVPVTKSSSDRSHTFTGLTANNAYTFSITAVGTGSYSNSDAGTRQVSTSGQVVSSNKLGTPVLRAGVVLAGSVSLNWNSVANAGSYRLSRTGSDVPVTKSSSDRNHVFLGLTANSLYTFSITAVGTGSYTDSDITTIQVRTGSAKLGTPVVRVDSVTARSATLLWNSVANASGYRLSRTGSNTVTKDSSATSHIFVGLTPSTVYILSVTAIGTGSYMDSASGSSQVRTNKQKLAGTVLSTGAVTRTSVTVNWNAVNNAGSYRLSKRLLLGGETEYVTVESSGTTYAFTGLSESTQYLFSIVAKDPNDVLEQSTPSTLAVTTSGGSQQLPRLSKPILNAYQDTPTSGNVTLTWAQVENATGYTLITYPQSDPSRYVIVEKSGADIRHNFRGLSTELNFFHIVAKNPFNYQESLSSSAEVNILIRQ